jgi:Rad3-related DNA helicase
MVSTKPLKGKECRYKTFLEDYKVLNRGTKNEQVYIDSVAEDKYRSLFSQWWLLDNFNNNDVQEKEWKPCGYYDQLNIALSASHSIFNYSNLLAFMPRRRNKTDPILMPRELLVLDEGHLLEAEVIRFRGFSVSKKRWKKYFSDFEIPSAYGYDDKDKEKWIAFLVELETKMFELFGERQEGEDNSGIIDKNEEYDNEEDYRRRGGQERSTLLENDATASTALLQGSI